MSVINICDDPYGSSFARALDTIDTNTINTMTERRMDLVLTRDDLFTAVFLNRINSDDISMKQKIFQYGDPLAIEKINSKYAEAR